MDIEYKRAIRDVIALLSDHPELHERIRGLVPPDPPPAPPPPPRVVRPYEEPPHVVRAEVRHRGRLVSRHWGGWTALPAAIRATRKLMCGCGKCIEMIFYYNDGEMKKREVEVGLPYKIEQGCEARSLPAYAGPPPEPDVFDELDELEE